MEINPPKLKNYQQAIIDSPARFTITEAATKTGKSFSHLWWLFSESLFPPKEGANYWWLSPVYSQAEVMFNRLKLDLIQSGGFRINESKLFIQNSNGGCIFFKSAENPETLYGDDVYAAVFDEFTRAKEEAWVALRTTLTATKGKCKLIGNVKGKKNWGHILAEKAKHGEPGYEYFKITAYDAINEGLLDSEEIAQAKRDMSEDAFKELYLAEALDDQANPFGIQHIQACLKPLSDNEPEVFGVDLAKSVDWTVVIGLDLNGDVCLFERWQSDWSQTRAKLIQIIGSKPAFIDSTGVGNPVVEEIQKVCFCAEGYTFTQISKQQIMEGLAYAIQNRYISVLQGGINDKHVMQDELEAFEYEFTRTGVRYRATEGYHDDTVCALALAFHKFKDKPAPPILSFHR